MGKAGTCTTEVKMATGGGAGPKSPVSLAWGKTGLVGRWTCPKYAKVGEVDWSFWESTLSITHPKLITSIGNKEMFSCSWLTAWDLHLVPWLVLVLSMGHVALVATWS